MRRGLLLLALMAAGCSPAAKDAADRKADNMVAAGKPSAAAPVPEPPAALSVRSEAKGFRIALADRLPVWRGERGNDCASGISCFDTPKTPGGKAVLARGWGVLSEQTAHGYTLVNFVGDSDQVPSTSYQVKDGQIALFRGGDLKALIWLAKGDRRAIGWIAPLASGDIRIFADTVFTIDHNVELPGADLHFGADGSIVVRALPASESVCGGKAVVPNIYGMRINRARKLVLKAGWLPDPLDKRNPPEEIDDFPSGRAFWYAAHGVPEVAGCAGTGFGGCGFNYKSKAGALWVMTIGDIGWPIVVRYEVECR